MTTSTAVRIGDAEREVVSGELGEHYAAGRLTYTELDERLDAVWSARSAADLRVLLADLPSTAGAVLAGRRSGSVDAGSARGGRRPWDLVAPLGLVVVIAVVAAIAVSGAPWPLFVAFWAWMLFGRRRAQIGWGPRRPALARASNPR